MADDYRPLPVQFLEEEASDDDDDDLDEVTSYQAEQQDVQRYQGTIRRDDDFDAFAHRLQVWYIVSY